jgi:hypothetical protein
MKAEEARAISNAAELNMIYKEINHAASKKWFSATVYGLIKKETEDRLVEDGFSVEKIKSDMGWDMVKIAW